MTPKKDTPHSAKPRFANGPQKDSTCVCLCVQRPGLRANSPASWQTLVYSSTCTPCKGHRNQGTRTTGGNRVPPDPTCDAARPKATATQHGPSARASRSCPVQSRPAVSIHGPSLPARGDIAKKMRLNGVLNVRLGVLRSRFENIGINRDD